MLAQRVPTVSISKAGIDPENLDRALAAQDIYVWSGHSYAVDVVRRLGLEDTGGVVRIGAVHYNTMAEIDRAVAVVAANV